MGNEMVSAAVVCIVITLVGLALGFGLLKLQGE
jgi:fumarate reductase subunit D